MKPNAVFIDIGNLLLKFELNNAFRYWAQFCDKCPIDLQQNFEIDNQFYLFQQSRVTTQEYFAHVAETLDVFLTLEQWVRGWQLVVVGVDQSRVEMLSQLDVPMYALSNTDVIHKKRWIELLDVDQFEHWYLSCDLGQNINDTIVLDAVRLSLNVDYENMLLVHDRDEAQMLKVPAKVSRLRWGEFQNSLYLKKKDWA